MLHRSDFNMSEKRQYSSINTIIYAVDNIHQFSVLYVHAVITHNCGNISLLSHSLAIYLTLFNQKSEYYPNLVGNQAKLLKNQNLQKAKSVCIYSLFFIFFPSQIFFVLFSEVENSTLFELNDINFKLTSLPPTHLPESVCIQCY